MKDVISFGSATRDIYLISKDFLVAGVKKLFTQKGIFLNWGSKIEVGDILFRTGGGGTNTVHTFYRQGLRAAWCGMIGKDEAGEAIIDEFKKIKADTSLISRTNKKPTNCSVILSAPGEEKTLLVYRGAAGELKKENIPWSKLKARWFYLAPLTGKLFLLFEDLVNFAQKHKIRVAANLGSSQLVLPRDKLKRILKKINILILNQEEASFLTKTSYLKEKEIFRKLDRLVPGICVMTKGKNGVSVSDGKYIYKAPSLKVKLIDSTGVGDAFNSGFLSGFIKSRGKIEKAIQLGTANAASCILKWGAKEGLLGKNQKFKKIKVRKIKC